jgi:hypothetical protein
MIKLTKWISTFMLACLLLAVISVLPTYVTICTGIVLPVTVTSEQAKLRMILVNTEARQKLLVLSNMPEDCRSNLAMTSTEK